MRQAFRGRRPLGSPHLATLSDAQLAAHLASLSSAAGARVASIAMIPRPAVELPTARFPDRLWRYSEPVRRSVATRFRKEQMALATVQAAEAAGGYKYDWVLWVREDAHWFAPLDLSRFSRGAVHGKACGGFGGWNDKVWLADRVYFGPLFSMYNELHTETPSRCQAVGSLPGAPSGRQLDPRLGQPSAQEKQPGPGGAVTLDFLAAPSVEQFRERVGLLRRIPYVRHPPEELPTMDSYYARADGGGELGAARGDVANGGEVAEMSGMSDAAMATGRQRERVREGGWRLCFPRIYARGCVPAVNQSRVDGMHCERERTPGPHAKTAHQHNGRGARLIAVG
jgi:hypothetical protein